MKKLLIIVLLIISTFLTTSSVFAQQIHCDDRYLTLINPIRSRDLWTDKSLKPLTEQYNLIKKHNFPATWLFQYDTLLDKDLLDEINKFDSNQEKGGFLEVSPNFAQQARTIYPHDVPWYSPKAIFLSAYSQSERRRLIDKLFTEFKLKFGFYPRSVGAWWIDSYSLNYMKDKYDIKTALIVADQKTTDNYGVWGQWWGVPYIPSKVNILTPANSLRNRQDVVILQWAQRDPILAIGNGPKFSNYSLQANDYIRQGKNTDYFQTLVNIYLDCQNPLGQVTMGLETGSDSVIYFREYAKQLEVLKNIPNLQPVTIDDFGEKFRKVYPDYPKKIIIGSDDSQWIMTLDERVNQKLNDTIIYNQEVSFDDYFITKTDEFLNRILPAETKQNQSLPMPLSLPILLAAGVYAYFKKKVKIWLASTLFSLASFGLILRSGFQFGWWVYYGPILQPLILYQIALPVVSFFTFIFLSRFRNINLWVIPLTFAFDPLIQSLRASYISEKYYIGFNLDALRFLGISFTKNFKLEFVNSDFPNYLAAGLLKFDYEKIWQNAPLALFVYPLIHIYLGLVLIFTLKRFLKLKRLIISILTFLLLVHLLMVFNSDPLFAVQ